MKKLTILALFAMLVATPVLADICENCGITKNNIDLWRAIDPSGNGVLTTFDLLLFDQFLKNCNGGFPVIFEADIIVYQNMQCDANGDGDWNSSDELILSALSDFFFLTGLTQVEYANMRDCLGAVILGICD